MPQTNKSYPLVSICIPTYNGEKYISETLDSVLYQTYQNIEVIITDDHSSDNTLSICNSYAKKDPRIKVFKNTKNLGLVNNWYESLTKASSKWVKFLFQDDLMTKDCVEKMIHCALNKKVDFVICNREYFFEKGFDPKIMKYYTDKLPKTENIFSSGKIYTPSETAFQIHKHIFNNCIGEPPTFLFNKEKITRKDFPDNYFQLIDYVFILNKILMHNFVFIDEKLIKFRVHTGSESMKNNNLDDSATFDKYLYIQYYEKIQICHEIIANPIYKDVKKYIPIEDIKTIKNFYTSSSYRRHSFEKVFPFYKKSNLHDFILDDYSSNYTYLKYKSFKIRNKSVRKKYNI